MANRPSLTAQAQELLIDVQIKAESGQYDDVRRLAQEAAQLVAQLDEDVMDAVHRIRYGKERRRW